MQKQQNNHFPTAQKSEESTEIEVTTHLRKIKNTNFLNNMHDILPWEKIVSLAELKYIHSGFRNSLIKTEPMIRIYFIQQWFKLSDMEIEEILFTCEAVRDFAQLKRGKDLIPGKAEINSFRQFIELQSLEKEFSEMILKGTLKLMQQT